MLLLGAIALLLIKISTQEQTALDRKDTFYRCLSTLDLPAFNITESQCNIEAALPECKELTLFAEYIESNRLTREHLSFDFAIETNYDNELDYIYLWDTAERCIEAISPDYLHIEVEQRDLLKPQEVYNTEACFMSIFKNNSYTSNGTLSFVLYTYLTVAEFYFSVNFEDLYKTRSAITGGYLHTCTTLFYKGDIDKCINYLAESCFVLDLYDGYYCFDSVIFKICGEFDGDKRFHCEVILEEKTITALENTCSSSENENKCEKIVTETLNKPITMLNSTDINSLRSVLVGGVHQINHTNTTFEQLNSIIAYFDQNKTAVSLLVDSKDVGEFYDVIDTLLEDDRMMLLLSNRSTEETDIGINFLFDLENITEIVSLSILNGNSKIAGNYIYEGNNTKLKFNIGRHNQKFFSGVLSIKNDSASISIPESNICEDVAEYEYSGNYAEYNYENCSYYDEYCDYYDLYELFEDCSRVLTIQENCETIVTTSVAQNLPELLAFGLPEHMSFASLVVSSSIMKMNNPSNDPKVPLVENATVHFSLNKETIHMHPKCHFFDMAKKMWSVDGIETIIMGENKIMCVTNHLTSFAVLIDHQGIISEIPETERVALSTVGYIGPVISIVCLISGIIITVIFRKHNNRVVGIIHLNLSIALLLSLVILVGGIETSRNIRWLCGLVTGLLHYFLLCVFCWMLVEGIILYVMVVHVWTKIERWYLFLPLGWGLPVVITGITVGVKYKLYGSNHLCWLTTEDGLIWSFLAPAILICVINMGILCVVVIQILRMVRNKSSVDTQSKFKNIKPVKSALIAIIFLSPLLGITWVIGLFAINSKTSVFLWLFTIFNSLQGAAIFFLHALQIKKISSKFGKTVKSKFSSSSFKSSTIRKAEESIASNFQTSEA